MTTLLARNTQIHQAVSDGPHDATTIRRFRRNDRADQRLADGHDGPVSATQQAYATVYAMVVKQAMVLSYIDNFRILAVMAFLGVPAAFLFKHVREAKAIEGAH